MHAKPGQEVRGGEPLFTLHTDEPARFADAETALAEAVVIAPAGSRPDRPGGPDLVLDRVG
jgi:thymidine phosphorylase